MHFVKKTMGRDGGVVSTVASQQLYSLFETHLGPLSVVFFFVLAPRVSNKNKVSVENGCV